MSATRETQNAAAPSGEPSTGEQTSHGRRFVKFLIVTLLLVEVVLPLVMYAFRDRLMFFPSVRPTPAERLGDFRTAEAVVVDVTRPDGRRLACYDVRPPQNEGEGVLLFLHGNAGNAALRADLIDWLAEKARVRVFLLEYSGFGGNPGKPTSDEIVTDSLAAFDHLVASGVEPGRIVLYGESVGGAAAVRVATERSPAGLITQSTFSSVSRVARRHYGWLPLAWILTRGELDNAALAPSVECPWLIVHGTADRIVPFKESEILSKAAPAAEVLPIELAGHNDLFRTGGADYVREIGDRVRSWTGR